MEIKDKFNRYAQILREWSGRMNLVAPSTLNDIETRHIADSVQLADFIPRDVEIIDMGSGAGFPGVVLAILGWDVVCVESVGKKALFLNAVKTELNLQNLTVFNGRLEDYINSRSFRQKGRENINKKDVIFTARAFAPLTRILDYVSGINYRLFLLKGREIETEISTAKLKHKFNYKLTPSKTGDGYILIVNA